jgi:phosphonate transport system substrate-binding protein
MRARVVLLVHALMSVMLAAVAITAHAQRPGRAAPAPTPPAERLVLAVNDDATGASDGIDVVSRYDDFAALMGRTLNRKVVFYALRDAAAVDAALRESRVDVLIARLVDSAARGVRDHGYRLVATARGDGFVVGIGRADSSLRSIEDFRGKRIALAAPTDYTSRMAIALLRDGGMNPSTDTTLIFHRNPAAIGYALEQNVADAGFVASSSPLGRTWEKQGGRVIVRGPRQPLMPVIAGAKVSPLELQRLRAMLLGLDRNDEGRAMLARFGVPGFDERDPADLVKLLAWLKL